MTSFLFWSLFHCFFGGFFSSYAALVIKLGLSYIKSYVKKHFLLNCSLKQPWLFPIHLLKNSYSDKYYWCSIYEPAKYFLGIPTSCWMLCNSHPINSFSNLKKITQFLQFKCWMYFVLVFTIYVQWFYSQQNDIMLIIFFLLRLFDDFFFFLVKKNKYGTCFLLENIDLSCFGLVPIMFTYEKSINASIHCMRLGIL